MEHLGEKYLSHGLRATLEIVSNVDKNGPELGHYSIVKTANEIVQLFQMHIQACEVHILAKSPSAHRNLVLAKNEFITSIESQLNQLIQKRINSKFD